MRMKTRRRCGSGSIGCQLVGSGPRWWIGVVDGAGRCPADVLDSNDAAISVDAMAARFEAQWQVKLENQPRHLNGLGQASQRTASRYSFRCRSLPVVRTTSLHRQRHRLRPVAAAFRCGITRATAACPGGITAAALVSPRSRRLFRRARVPAGGGGRGGVPRKRE